MIRITKADQTTEIETEIYALGATDGFYNIKINEKVNDYGSMTFSCIPSVANFKLNDIITVYKDNNVYWQGIIVSITRNFYGDLNVVCYSMLWTLTFNYLQERNTTGKTFGTVILDIQNENNTDAGSGQTINSQYVLGSYFDYLLLPLDTTDDRILPLGTTLSQIQALFDPYCFFYAEYVPPFNPPYCVRIHIVDYNNVSNVNILNQPIEFGLNLLDYAEENAIANYITSVAPIGKTAGGTPVFVGSFSGTITFNGQTYTVNQNGSGYIKNPVSSIITEYGERRARVEFDIDNVNDLMDAGVKWLERNAFQELTITLSAADLSALTSLNYDEFKVGYFVNVKSMPFGLATMMPILERSIDIQDPAKSTITLSNTYQTTLTEQVRRNTN